MGNYSGYVLLSMSKPGCDYLSLGLLSSMSFGSLFTIDYVHLYLYFHIARNGDSAEFIRQIAIFFTNLDFGD